MRYFVNFSNHPSENWSAEQRMAAEAYGKIVDVPFPQVDPAAGEDDIIKLGDRFVEKILELNPAAVMVQGEFTLTFRVIGLLKGKGIRAVSACTARNTEEYTDAEGKQVKKSVFVFRRFREYV